MNTVDALAAAWFAVLNVAALTAFGYDKWRAGRSGRRVSEATLLVLGASGGWFGGFAGMKFFRHKTAKRTFQIKYALTFLPFAAELWAWQHWR